MEREELWSRAWERVIAERLRAVKLAGTSRYLVTSRTVAPGAYFELFVSPWGHVRCTCPAYAFRAVCKHAAAVSMKLDNGENRR